MCVFDEIADPGSKLRKSSEKFFSELCKENFFGEKDCYNFEQGIGDVARVFLLLKTPYGSYKIKGEEVMYLNVSVLSPENKELLSRIKTIKTEAPSIIALSIGKILKTRALREPLVEVLQRDHDEN